MIQYVLSAFYCTVNKMFMKEASAKESASKNFPPKLSFIFHHLSRKPGCYTYRWFWN